MITESFRSIKAVLYQPDEVLGVRVPRSGAFVEHLVEVQKVFAAFCSGLHEPEVMAVVVAIKPGGRVRAWFVSTSRPDHDAATDRLRREIESLRCPAVYSGPVAFAIVGGIGGAQLDAQNRQLFDPPLPQEWRDAAARSSEPALIPDDVLEASWPDLDGEVAMSTDTPLSDLISRVVADPSSKRALAAFHDALIKAPVGIMVPEAPTGTRLVAPEDLRLATARTPDGRDMLLACADRPTFAKRFHERFNAEVFGGELLATALDFDCDGVMVNSAASSNSIIVDKDVIVEILGKNRPGLSAPEVTERRSSRDQGDLCPCGSGALFAQCHGTEDPK